jgi:hypothetical protein
MKLHLSTKSTNTCAAYSTFVPRECQEEVDMPVIVDASNRHIEGVDVADQY